MSYKCVPERQLYTYKNVLPQLRNASAATLDAFYLIATEPASVVHQFTTAKRPAPYAK